MDRIISLLLIPFFVLGQALPHSHAGTSVTEAADHALRPHLHVHELDHDHDEHGGHVDEVKPSPQYCPLHSTADHDSDAALGSVTRGSTLCLSAGAKRVLMATGRNLGDDAV